MRSRALQCLSRLSSAAFFLMLCCSPIKAIAADKPLRPWQFEGHKLGLADPDLEVRAHSLKSLLDGNATEAVRQTMKPGLSRTLAQLLASGTEWQVVIGLRTLEKLPDIVPEMEIQVRQQLDASWATAALAATALAGAGLLRESDVSKLLPLIDGQRFIAGTAAKALAALKKAGLLKPEHGRRIAEAFAVRSRKDEPEVARVLLDAGLLQIEDIAILKSRLAQVAPDSDSQRYLAFAGVLAQADALDDDILNNLEKMLTRDMTTAFAAASIIKPFPEKAHLLSQRLAARLTIENMQQWETLAYAIDFLGQGARGAYPAVEQVLRSKAENSSYFALAILSTMDALNEKHVPAALELLNSSTPRHILLATTVLKRLKVVPNIVAAKLLPLVDHSDDGISLGALSALREEKLLTSAHIELLKQSFAGAQNMRRFAVANVICDIKPHDEDVLRAMKAILVQGPPNDVPAFSTIRAWRGFPLTTSRSSQVLSKIRDNCTPAPCSWLWNKPVRSQRWSPYGWRIRCPSIDTPPRLT